MPFLILKILLKCINVTPAQILRDLDMLFLIKSRLNLLQCSSLWSTYKSFTEYVHRTRPEGDLTSHLS